LKTPTADHLKIRAVADACANWELDLERVDRLTKGEAYLVVSIVAEQFLKDVFPLFNGNRFVELAREGWEHLKEADRLIKLYPECGDQTNIHGVWIML
jgi:hypothetical protein